MENGIVTEDGYAKITLNIRYPLGITFEQIVERVGRVAEKSVFSVLETQKRTLPRSLRGGICSAS